MREAKRRKRELSVRTMQRRKLKEEDPQAYAEMLRKTRERQSIKYKIKFDEPQPCPHCAKTEQLQPQSKLRRPLARAQWRG